MCIRDSPLVGRQGRPRHPDQEPDREGRQQGPRRHQDRHQVPVGRPLGASVMAKDEEEDKPAPKPKAERPPREKTEKKKKATEPAGPPPKYKREQLPRLRRAYDDTVRGQMMKEFNYTSIMQVPRVVKVTLNMGLGRANQDAKVIEAAVDEMKQILSLI